LKSSVAIVGAESMVVLLKKIEQLASNGADSCQILELNNELLQLYNIAQVELKAYLESSC
jgi:HPt (histidine-containing phosphotransfer) domain-containing protein